MNDSKPVSTVDMDHIGFQLCTPPYPPPTARRGMGFRIRTMHDPSRGRTWAGTGGAPPDDSRSWIDTPLARVEAPVGREDHDPRRLERVLRLRASPPPPTAQPQHYMAARPSFPSPAVVVPPFDDAEALSRTTAGKRCEHESCSTVVVPHTTAWRRNGLAPGSAACRCTTRQRRACRAGPAVDSATPACCVRSPPPRGCTAAARS